jgi:hypothetical protein
LAPLLALAGGPAALRELRGWAMNYQTLGMKANYLIQQGAVTFNDERIEAKFRAAFPGPT